MGKIFSETSIICIKHVTRDKFETNSFISGGKRMEHTNSAFLSSYLNSDFLEVKKNSQTNTSNELASIILKFQEKIREYPFEVELYIYTKSGFVEIMNGNVTCDDERIVKYVRLIVKSDVRVFYEDLNYEWLFSEGLDDIVNKRIEELIAINKLEQVTISTPCPVIFSPGTGGYLIHEVIGHMLELDNLSNTNKEVFDRLSINSTVSLNLLNVTDSVSGFETLVGLNKIDDEGNKLNTKRLIKDGKIKGIIDRVGCSRRSDFKLESMPRMRATMVHNGLDLKFVEMVGLYPKAVVIDQIMGGGVDIKTGNYQLISNGRFFEKGAAVSRVENLIICGNSIKTLEDLEYIGNDLRHQHSYCIKKNQLIDIVVGSPTISFRFMEMRGY